MEKLIPSSMKILTRYITTFPIWATHAPVLCGVCYSGNFSFPCCLEEGVADGSGVVITSADPPVVVMLVLIAKKPLSESVIVPNFNTAVDAQGKSWWGNQNSLHALCTTVTTRWFLSKFSKGCYLPGQTPSEDCSSSEGPSHLQASK